MTKRDLFRIIIKIFALYLIVQTLFTVIPQSYVFVMREFDPGGFVVLLATLAIMFLILYFLIVKTDWIISILKLDQGYDSDKLDMNGISNLTLLKFGIILIGGIFIIRNFIPLITNLSLIFRSLLIPDIEGRHTAFLPKTDYIHIIIYTLNVFIGYLMLTNVQRISNWLNRYEKNNNEA